MKRLFIIISVSSLFILSSCWRDHQNNSKCGYCDDSGCYSCDGDYCWPVENEACGDSDPCAENEICTEYGCASLCIDDAQCNLGEECLASGYCSPKEAPETKCVVDDDCGNGTICEFDETLGYNICIPGCGSDDDCGDGEVCAACGRCVPEDNPVCGDSKVFCETSDECGAKVCNTDHKCAITCTESDPLCPTGQICVSDVCVDDPSPANPECVFSSDCTDGVCLNSYCHATCEVDTECGYGEFCHLGVCKADYTPDFGE